MQCRNATWVRTEHYAAGVVSGGEAGSSKAGTSGTSSNKKEDKGGDPSKEKAPSAAKERKQAEHFKKLYEEQKAKAQRLQATQQATRMRDGGRESQWRDDRREYETRYRTDGNRR